MAILLAETPQRSDFSIGRTAGTMGSFLAGPAHLAVQYRK
jgi:hypothetical protein